MELIDRQELNQLLDSEGGPHVTLFLPPPQRPMEAKEDGIRISNWTREAMSVLSEHWMPEREAEGFIQPLSALATDDVILGDRPHGVAIYLSQNHFKLFRLDQPIEPKMVIDRVFHIRPMLSVVEERLSFSVLRISKKAVSLFDVFPKGVEEIKLEGIAESFEASLSSVSADPGSQTHSAAHGSGAIGKQAAVFHGQGGLPDAEKAELTEYLRRLDGAVCVALADRHNWLVLAGVDYETAIYRNLSNYPRLAVESVSGNMDHLSPQELAERAKPIAAAENDAERNTEAEEIRERRHQPVATDAEQVLKAAHAGQIKTLFVDHDASLTGSFYEDTATLKELRQEPTGQPGDPCHDLIELAAVQTLKHGGRVYSVGPTEMPVDAKMVAALRY